MTVAAFALPAIPGIMESSHREQVLMPARSAIYVKKPGSHYDENTSEIQAADCETYCNTRGLEIVALYADLKGVRDEFHRMMESASSADSPFGLIVVRRRANFAPSLEEAIHCLDKLKANGVALVSTTGR